MLVHKSSHTMCHTNFVYCFAVYVFVISSQNIDQGVHPTIFESSIESWFLSYEEKYTYCLSKKAKHGSCHGTTFYSIFNISSFRKPEVYTKWLA